MERLTKRSKNGGVYFPEELEGVTLMPDNITIHRLLWRLAAYEDTGLEPEQCVTAKALIYAAFSDDTSKVERIRELLKADKEGRLVVLPCEPGDMLWTFRSYPVEQVYSFTVTDISTLNGRTMLNTSHCGVIDARDVGKIVFLTREEAKKALEAKSNDDRPSN